MKHSHPSIVFVGVHQEAREPFRHLIRTGERLLGLVTLESKRMPKVSGAVDLTEYAEAAGVPVLRVKNVNDERSVEWIRRKSPDVILVIGWTQLLREELLGIPSVACLGFHASLLPKYRGRAPVNWALIHGETETGNTMIVLEPGADEGDIVAQRRIAITEDDDCGTLYDKVAATEVDMLAEVLPLIRQGRLPRRKQDDARATVMPKRRPSDGVIDWTRSARQVYDWVRAQTHPYPGAFTHAGNEKIWIWKCRKVEGEAADGADACGTVRADEEGWPLVATGAGRVLVLEAQIEGGGPVSGIEAAQRFLRPGTILGSTEITR